MQTTQFNVMRQSCYVTFIFFLFDLYFTRSNVWEPLLIYKQDRACYNCHPITLNPILQQKIQHFPLIFAGKPGVQVGFMAQHVTKIAQLDWSLQSVSRCSCQSHLSAINIASKHSKPHSLASHSRSCLLHESLVAVQPARTVWRSVWIQSKTCKSPASL